MVVSCAVSDLVTARPPFQQRGVVHCGSSTHSGTVVGSVSEEVGS